LLELLELELALLLRGLPLLLLVVAS